MDFTVTVLGSSAALPTAMRQCSAQVVNIEGFKMLIDCGEGAQNQIRRCRIKMQSISHIFISHLHGDHLFGLPGLLSSMHLCTRVESVNIYAPKGIRQLLDNLLVATGASLGYDINYFEIEGNDPMVLLENNKCKVTAFPLIHSVPTYGFLVEEQQQLLNLKRGVKDDYNLAFDDMMRIKNGHDHILADGTVVPNAQLTKPRKPTKKYAYCCDTLYSDTLLPYIKDVDLLCFDCTFDKSLTAIAEEKLHGTTLSAATAAVSANAKRLMLTHFSARYSEVDSLVMEAQTIFPNTIAACDGTRYEV